MESNVTAKNRHRYRNIFFMKNLAPGQAPAIADQPIHSSQPHELLIRATMRRSWILRELLEDDGSR
jgi:hypothetical protein